MSLDTTTAAFCDSSQLNHDVSSHSTGGNEESVRHAGVCHTLAGRDRKCGWKQSDKKEDKEKEQIKKNWDDEEEHIRGKQTIIARDLSRSSEDADKQKCSFFDQRSSLIPDILTLSVSTIPFSSQPFSLNLERRHNKVHSTVPVEHVERVGVTRHGDADELGTAELCERHTDGGQRRRTVLDLVEDGEELLGDEEKSDELALNMVSDAPGLHSIFSRPMLLCLKWSQCLCSSIHQFE
ncbi:hypothetical protein BLNAU_22131 [Blattamonas nauphoetae]|uniref:Uncharacterized protein n=1 Tax=Blattamonas nauphoetae TaxID=2049346 RepID=A0ABQ9WW87_9EUKA|nr:hypothetical protein BLNAU_22131 [Blattamonas nauphoetae]